MKEKARGYIASGEYEGNRSPQHIQNQIVKMYCDANNLQFVLSRAEYWMNGSTQCQLWAALREGFQHIVLFSIWQLPNKEEDRLEVYKYCVENKISLHFATERMHLKSEAKYFSDIEILIKTQQLINSSVGSVKDFSTLKKLL